MFWTVLIAAISFLSLGISFTTIRRNTTTDKALKEAERQKEALSETLISVMDESGNIRGQLALPGQISQDHISHRMTDAEGRLERLRFIVDEADRRIGDRVKSSQDLIKTRHDEICAEIKILQDALKTALDEVKTARAQEAAVVKTIAEVVDPEGKVLVQLRLPGKRVKPPNKTPCGDMCKNAFLGKEKKYHAYGGWFEETSWCCRAGQNRACDKVRHEFQDGEGQCVMFERDDDC